MNVSTFLARFSLIFWFLLQLRHSDITVTFQFSFFFSIAIYFHLRFDLTTKNYVVRLAKWSCSRLKYVFYSFTLKKDA